MDIYTDYLPQLLLVVGLLMLAVEVAILGFATFVLFFIGIACVLTSCFMYIGVLQPSLLTAMLSIAIITAVSAAVLWRPLKKLQSQNEGKKIEQGFVGHQFVLQSDISPSNTGSYQYSGVSWIVISEQTIAAGTRVEVIDLEVGKFFVKICQ